MKRWLTILGLQQVVLISNTHTSNTEICFKIKRRQKGIGEEKAMKRGLAILGPQQVVLIRNTHTQNYFKIKKGQERVEKIVA